MVPISDPRRPVLQPKLHGAIAMALGALLLSACGNGTTDASSAAATASASQATPKVRISRTEGQRFTARRSMVSRHAGPVLVMQDVCDFLSVMHAGQ